MGNLRRLRPSPALVISLIALFVAMGGIGYAAAKIGTSDIENGAVTTKKLHNKAVTTKKIKANAVTGAKAKESSFGQVPDAAHADNASNLGGTPASGYESRIKWALVKADGSIIAQSGGISVTHSSGSNGYYLDFGSSVAGKGVSVTLHYNDPNFNGEIVTAPCGGSGVPGGVTCVAAGTNDANHLYVQVHDSTGGNGGVPNGQGFYATVIP
jgi:hypothetical protein